MRKGKTCCREGKTRREESCYNPFSNSEERRILEFNQTITIRRSELGGDALPLPCVPLVQIWLGC